jgi:hypothetical protein
MSLKVAEERGGREKEGSGGTQQEEEAGQQWVLVTNGVIHLE